MSLKDLKDNFKIEYGWTDSISIGKIDNNKEKAICFYNSKYSLAYRGVIGGNKNKTTEIKPITILLRYTKNQDTAETMAESIYKFFEDRTFFINKKRIFTQMVYEYPINLGTDENNVYEYSIEIYFYVSQKEG